MYGLVDAKANAQAANFFGFSAEDTPALLIQGLLCLIPQAIEMAAVHASLLVADQIGSIPGLI